MIAAYAFVSLVGGADGGMDVIDDGGKAGWIAGVFDQQSGLRDAGRRLGEREMRGEAGPGGQPAFGGAQAAKADGTEVRRQWIFAPQRTIGAIGWIQRQIEIAQVRIGPPDGHDFGVPGATTVGEAATILRAFARGKSFRDQPAGGFVQALHASNLRRSVTRDELR